MHVGDEPSYLRSKDILPRHFQTDPPPPQERPLLSQTARRITSLYNLTVSMVRKDFILLDIGV